MTVSLRSGALIFAVGYFAWAAFPFARSYADTAALYKDCEANPSVRCLTELGILEAREHPERARFGRTLAQLGELGRIEESAELHAAVEIWRGITHPDAIRHADRRVASHRLAEALRSGESVEVAVSQTPEVYPGAFWIAALDLLGRQPYGPNPRREKQEVSDQIIAELSTALAESARADTTLGRMTSLVHAAEIALIAGRIEAARALLDQITPGEPHRGVRLSADLIRAIGFEQALSFYRRTELVTQFAHMDIALAVPGHPRSDPLIRDAFRTLAEKTPFPEYADMRDVVRRVAASGKTELALALARELGTIAQTGPRVFPAFPHIDTADALYAAGAPVGEVADALDRAEVEFPRDPKAVIGMGVVGGVYS